MRVLNRSRNSGGPVLGVLENAKSLVRALSDLKPAEEESWHLVLGPVGSGKTLLLACAVTRWAEQGHASLYLPEKRLWAQKRSSAAARGPNDYQEGREYSLLLDRAKNAQILLVDDLGSAGTEGDLKPWMVEDMADLIAHRYEQRLLTLLSSNLSLPQLADMWGARTMDRIYEMTDRGRSIWNLSGWNWRGGRPS